jgi:small-conductance mechanosensitive channel
VLQAAQALQDLDARIRLDFKRALGFGFVALGCLIAGAYLGGVTRHGTLKWVVVGLTVGFVAFGALAVRSTARELSRVARSRAGFPAASALRTLCLVFGALLILLGLLQLLNLSLRTVLLGGAITGVVVGIAAQQPLGNFFAGLVLLFARPYVPGQYVRVRTGGLGGPFEGKITYAGLMYTVIETADGPVSLPNLGLMSAAIGPVPEPEPEPESESESSDGDEDEDETPQPGTGTGIG